MPKKLNSWVKIETLSYLKVVSFGFLFSILLANCNDPGPKVNWLDHWEAIPFTADPTDEKKIDTIKKNIRIYVRGWLAEHNAEKTEDYIVKEFNFDIKSSDPLAYTVKAFLKPPARTEGYHLIPPPPPPPPPQVAYKTGQEGEPINWLKGWKGIKDKVINSTKVELDKGIEAYVRGWLAMKNIEMGTKYTIEKFELKEVIGSPKTFTVIVFLNPPVTEPKHDHDEDEEIGGAHLIPPPPPPPSGS